MTTRSERIAPRSDRWQRGPHGDVGVVRLHQLVRAGEPSGENFAEPLIGHNLTGEGVLERTGAMYP